MQEKQDVEKSFVTTDESTGKTELDLSIFLRTLIQRCMGKALDYGRMSGMSDRSLTQFERSVKDEFYKIIKDGTKILEEFGYTNGEPPK
jgi:hypothetical protein